MNAKRAFDVAASGVALCVFAPVLAVAALAITWDDGGSVLFRQERVGRGGRPFVIHKLRTMREGVVTRPGRWLRATGIDEVAQFWDVLRGEMSVVGPRPLTRADTERLGFHRSPDRWSVRPGITGPSQVLAPPTAAEVLQSDLRYVASAGLATDCRLVAWSFAMNVFGKQRIRAHLRKGAGGMAAPA